MIFLFPCVDPLFYFMIACEINYALDTRTTNYVLLAHTSFPAGTHMPKRNTLDICSRQSLHDNHVNFEAWQLFVEQIIRSTSINCGEWLSRLEQCNGVSSPSNRLGIIT